MKSRNRKLFTIMLALSLWAALGAKAFAQYSFGITVPATATGTYDWDGTTEIPVTAYANYNSTTDRFLFWAFNPITTSRTLSYSGNTIPYTVYKFISSNQGPELWSWLQTPKPTTTNVFSVYATNKFTNSPMPFLIVVEPGHLKPSGTYTGSITIVYYNGTVNGTTITSGTQRATKVVPISLTNPAICDLALVGTGESFNIGATSKSLPFGDVTTATNPSLQAKAIVRSNATSWSLFAQSLNGGVMKTGTQTLSYTFNYNGSVKTLTTSPQLMEAGNWAATTDGYAERTMTITLGDTFVEPGTYEDTITFTMTYNG